MVKYYFTKNNCACAANPFAIINSICIIGDFTNNTAIELNKCKYSNIGIAGLCIDFPEDGIYTFKYVVNGKLTHCLRKVNMQNKDGDIVNYIEIKDGKLSDQFITDSIDIGDHETTAVKLFNSGDLVQIDRELQKRAFAHENDAIYEYAVFNKTHENYENALFWYSLYISKCFNKKSLNSIISEYAQCLKLSRYFNSPDNSHFIQCLNYLAIINEIDPKYMYQYAELMEISGCDATRYYVHAAENGYKLANTYLHKYYNMIACKYES